MSNKESPLGSRNRHKDMHSKKKTTIVEELTQKIASGIISGRYAPGQRLIEADLVNEYKVSRNPLREAYSRLASDGLLTIQPYRGAFVSKPSRKEIMDLFIVRESLELLAVQLAARNICVSEFRDEAKEIAIKLSANQKENVSFSDYY
ncbi:MAG: GntR family transcriptional regulator, partial [Gammaproteobacteria bacterium]|nr:GntR family transcriptional regulator [Gammaproteobacteria bacterium]